MPIKEESWDDTHDDEIAKRRRRKIYIG